MLATLLFLALHTSPAVEPPSPADREFAAGQARFATALQRELASTPGNVACSPLSLSRALAMARTGAAGTTASEMDAVLHLPPDASARFTALARHMRAPEIGPKGERRPAYSLELATAMFGQSGAQFVPDYGPRLRAGFESELLSVDFARTEEARATINTWAALKTRERVRDLVPPDLIRADTRLVLVDTVHFLGAWTEPFDVDRTKPMPFTRLDASVVETLTMSSSTERMYAETALAQIVELPYQGGTMSMVFVLPKKGKTLDALLRTEDFGEWTKALEERLVDLSLPKFEIRFSAELKTILTKLGMSTPFDLARADFSGILREPLAISAVVQQTFVGVDEHGTEAAAASAVMMWKGAKPDSSNKPAEFRADRPFGFFLRHRPTGAVLFCGHVTDPSAPR